MYCEDGAHAVKLELIRGYILMQAAPPITIFLGETLHI